MARPKKNPQDKYSTPQRSVRISDDEWDMIKQAAVELEMPHTVFVREAAIRWAKRIVRKQSYT